MDSATRDPREQFGLSRNASLAEVEEYYCELEDFLELSRIPKALRPWALRQRALADKAYAALLTNADAGEFDVDVSDEDERRDDEAHFELDLDVLDRDAKLEPETVQTNLARRKVCLTRIADPTTEDWLLEIQTEDT